MTQDTLNIYGDIGSNHGLRESTFTALCEAIQAAGAIPKIQLYSEQTFPQRWGRLLPDLRFVPSVFTLNNVKWVTQFNPEALKIASVESTHWDLLNACMETRLPLIISTGGMNDTELLQLIDQCEEYMHGVCLMHCVSLYPTPLEAANVSRIATLYDVLSDALLDWDLGWSCHVDPNTHLSTIRCMAAMAYTYGATHFEVHVRAVGVPMTPDECVAMTPFTLRMLVDTLRGVQTWDGDGELIGADRDSVVALRRRWQV